MQINYCLCISCSIVFINSRPYLSYLLATHLLGYAFTVNNLKTIIVIILENSTHYIISGVNKMKR